MTFYRHEYCYQSQACPERLFLAFLRFKIAKLSSEYQILAEPDAAPKSDMLFFNYTSTRPHVCTDDEMRNETSHGRKKCRTKNEFKRKPTDEKREDKNPPDEIMSQKCLLVIGEWVGRARCFLGIFFKVCPIFHRL